MSYATYECYKDSGVDWLGEIPSTWTIRKLKHIVKIHKRIIGHEGIDVLSITQRGIVVKDITSGAGQLAMDYSKYQIVEIGDFAMNHMDLLTGYVDISKFEGVVSPDYRVFKNESKEINDDYLLKIFQIGYNQKIFYKYGQGVSMLGRWRLPAENFNLFSVPIPSTEEQTKIIEFLDQKTAQIDQAIALKQQQIEKLGEYKQIVIQNAVTKGLNPNAPMKDSGVAWIGDIPEHWEMVSIKRIAKISPKVDLSNYKLDEKVTFLPMEKVSSNGDIDCEILKPIREVKQGFTAFKKNDVILAKITPCFENGKGALLDKLETEIGYGSTEFHVLRASKRIKAYYLYLITHSSNFLTLGEAMMTGSAGQKRVPTDFVANYQFPLPPMSEQQQIIEYVENLNRKISDTIQSYQTQIDRLKEYKNILINQAVTGKIKI